MQLIQLWFGTTTEKIDGHTVGANLWNTPLDYPAQSGSENMLFFVTFIEIFELQWL